MKNATASRTYQVDQDAEPQASYPLWKDLSVLGCLFFGFLFGIGVLALFGAENGIPKVREVTGIKAELQQEIDQLQRENSRLLQEIDAMKTDPFWQEKIAREELNMALPGEIIYKFSE